MRLLAGGRILGALVGLATLLVPGPTRAQSTSVLSLLPTEGRRLEVGSEETGALSTSDPLSHDDHYLEAWELRARSGESATIEVTSDAFDARVYVVGPGFSETQFAEDGAGGCNPRLTLTFLESGTFRVAVSSLSEGETGTYRIRVADRPGPPPAYRCGDVSPEVLNALPVEGRATLRVGSTEAGFLDAFSPLVIPDRPGQAWRVLGSPGQRLSITASSQEFDTYLYLIGPGLDEVLTDDDSGGDLDARIDVTLPTSGPFTLVAAAYSSDTLGSYTLRIEEPLDLNTLDTGDRVIDLGQEVSGSLDADDPIITEGRRGQAWAFPGVLGQRVVIDLEADDFDAYLYLVGPGLTDPIEDDDGSGSLNSRIETELPGSGIYRIVAASLQDGTGEYTLRVTQP